MTDPIAPDALREAVLQRLLDLPWRARSADIVADAVLAEVAKHRDAEVERLTAENDRLRVMWDKSGKNDLIAEVERLRAEVATRHLQYLTVQGVADGERAAHIICDDSLKDAQDRIARALAYLDTFGPDPADDRLRAILRGDQ